MEKYHFCISWKMNLNVADSMKHARKIKKLYSAHTFELKQLDFFILPDLLSIYPVSLVLAGSRVRFGSQDCFWEDSGAYTGEVSPRALKEIGCDYVLLGHPERISNIYESVDSINKKLAAVLRNKMTPCLLVYEKDDITSKAARLNDLKSDLQKYIRGIKPDDINRIIIVYEPLWTIGSSETAPAEHVSEVINFLRSFLDIEFGNKTGKGTLHIWGRYHR